MLHILTFVGFVTVAAGASLYDELMTVNCTSYLEWVDKTNLTSLLMGEEDNVTYTVFAPDNDAIAAISDEEMAILTSDLQHLQNLVLYHIHHGAVDYDKLVTLRMMSTILPAYVMTVMVNFFGMGDTTLNEHAIVNPAYADADNGIVYSVSSVLIPGKVAAVLG